VQRRTAVDRRWRSVWPRYHAHMRWILPLPLASAASRRTPRRASSQLMTSQWKPTTTAISQYLQDAAIDTRVARIFCIVFWPWPMTLTFSARLGNGHDPYAYAKSERPVGWKDKVETNGQTHEHEAVGKNCLRYVQLCELFAFSLRLFIHWRMKTSVSKSKVSK